jgi:DNA-binding transcriptional MerR regulator
MSGTMVIMNEKVEISGWSGRELAKRVSVPASTVADWISKGLITPERSGRGRGGHTIGLLGLMELLTIIELKSAGFSVQDILKSVKNLQRLSGAARPLAQLILVVSGKDVLWKNADDLDAVTLSALRQPGQRLMVFPVGEKYQSLLDQLRLEDSSSQSPV